MRKPYTRVFTHTGSTVKPIYDLFVDGATYTLKVVGHTDLASYIDSFADSVDINVIISRFANGEITSLPNFDTFYGNVVHSPKTLAEAYKLVSDGRNFYDKLDPKVRDSFGSFENFITGNIVKPFDREVSELVKDFNKGEVKDIES